MSGTFRVWDRVPISGALINLDCYSIIQKMNADYPQTIEFIEKKCYYIES